MDENRGKKGFLFFFECFMAVFYIAFASILLFTGLLDNAFGHKAIKLTVGILFGAYGLYRIARAWKQIRDKE